VNRGVGNFGTDEWFDAFLRGLSPTIADDLEMQRWMRRWIRESTSPGALLELRRMNSRLDARHVLSSINVPTLVLHPVDDTDTEFACGQYIADHVPGSQLVELPGDDHGWWVRPDEIGDHAERFLTGLWESGDWAVVEPDRVLATVLFTDIVGSTEKLAEVGDRRWRELLGEHHKRVRRQLVRYRGREIDTAGDGFFAAFDGPARAIRCACAITDAVRELGIEVRAGLHTGECEDVDGKVGGIAVHIGARVAANAGPGEVVVSRTVRDLVSGSGIEFRDRGSVDLKGVPGSWELFSVA
jgi:class 3 adenylate cyclase